MNEFDKKMAHDRKVRAIISDIFLLIALFVMFYLIALIRGIVRLDLLCQFLRSIGL
jgi:hypothetical protein